MSIRIRLELICDDAGFRIDTNIFEHLPEIRCSIIDTEKMGMAFEPEQRYENPDGSDIILDTDYFGNPFGENPLPGPFACLNECLRGLADRGI